MMQPSSSKAAEQLPGHFDYTVVGGGASGLWLAMALYDEGLLETRSLCIVERDAAKENDRTWCYWAAQPITSADIPSHSWQQMQHPSVPGSRVHIGPYRYHHLRSADFYAYAKKYLSNCPNIVWLHDEVSAVEQGNGVARISTGSHHWTSERAFVSSIPAKGELKKYLGRKIDEKQRIFIWQSFVGWRVVAEKPVFHPESATMMRFDIQQGDSTQFMYELPFSANEALVEMTRFGSQKLAAGDATEQLHAFMAGKGSAYTVTEWEVNSIPMTPYLDMRRRNLPADCSIIYIGTAGGAVKPTTGYAFRRMAGYSGLLAKAIKQGLPLPTMRRPWRFRLYDILLLQILQYHPQRGKAIFERLFATQSLQRIFKFLDEESSLREELAIFARLPLWVFIRSVAQYIVKR